VINAAGRVVGVCSHGNNASNSNYDPVAVSYAWLREQACPLFSPASPDTAFCSELCPCPSAQADCDVDSDCESGAACIDNVGAGIGFPGFWDVCWATAQVVTMYRDPSFAGPSRELPLGQWDLADFGSIPNDGPSSFKIPPGLTVRAFQEAGCWADQQAFSGDTTDIVGPVRDNVSCVRVLPGVTVYDLAGFNGGGAKQTFEVGNYNAAALTGVGNNTISSLIATPGISVRLCSDSGPAGGAGTGNCNSFGGQTPSVGFMNNVTSHIEVRAGVTLYREPSFFGIEQSLPVGFFNAGAMNQVGDDTVSSLVVAPGLQARVCSEIEGAGDCQTFTGWVGFVGPLLNERISSVQITPLP